MNCTQVEKLLALHVEGDTGETHAREVCAHLQSCDDCLRLADEFAASQSLLRLHTPPEFDSAFFDGIRRNVLREIGNTHDRPTLIPTLRASLTQLFARRSFAFAASLSLIVAACALFALQLYRRQTTPTPSATAHKNTSGSTHNAPHAAPAAEPREPHARVVEQAHTLRAPGAGVPSSKSMRATRRPAQSLAATGATPVPTPDARSNAAVAAQAQTIESATHARAAMPFAPETVAGVERKMTRIELQTGDPNVRIIWLSPQTADKISTKK